jgi:hypothetical protein
MSDMRCVLTVNAQAYPLTLVVFLIVRQDARKLGARLSLHLSLDQCAAAQAGVHGVPVCMRAGYARGKALQELALDMVSVAFQQLLPAQGFARIPSFVSSSACVLLP